MLADHSSEVARERRRTERIRTARFEVLTTDRRLMTGHNCGHNTVQNRNLILHTIIITALVLSTGGAETASICCRHSYRYVKFSLDFAGHATQRRNNYWTSSIAA